MYLRLKSQLLEGLLLVDSDHVETHGPVIYPVFYQGLITLVLPYFGVEYCRQGNQQMTKDYLLIESQFHKLSPNRV
jgi:hypothetical protein